MRDTRDVLVHSLLTEIVGGDEPPDLTRRIMAGITRRRRNRVLSITGALAAAAAILLAVVLVETYPSPRLAGDAEIEGGGEVRRGARVVAKDDVTLRLGGYCRVALARDSIISLQGAERAEVVYLERGSAICDVDTGVGAFSVRTDVGTVKVTGTRFEVLVFEGEEIEVKKRYMLVSVLAGAVTCSGAWGETGVGAGEVRILPPPTSKLQTIRAPNKAALAALERKVSFEFVETSLSDALAFLNRTTGVAVRTSPQAVVRRTTPITLRVTDMPLKLALKWILRLIDLDYVVDEHGVLVTTPQHARELRGPAAPTAKQTDQDSDLRNQAVRAALERKVSFEFVDTPLTETAVFLQQLTGVSMVIDPELIKRGDPAVSLRLTDTALDDAFGQMLRLVGADFVVANGAVFITTVAKARAKSARPAAAANARTFRVMAVGATGKVVISGGAAHGIRAGQRFDVRRDGRLIGVIVARNVYDAMSGATAEDGERQIQKGDVVEPAAEATPPGAKDPSVREVF